MTRRVARNGMGLKTLFLREDLAGLRKVKNRAERELAVAKVGAVDAQTAYEVSLDDGADDETLRAAVTSNRRQAGPWRA